MHEEMRVSNDKKVPPPPPPPPPPPAPPDSERFRRHIPGGGRVEKIDKGTAVTDTFAPPPKPKK